MHKLFSEIDAEIDANLNLRLATYTAAHKPVVRDLAEMISLAISSDSTAESLADAEDTRAIVLRECVALYAAKHRIGGAELQAAFSQWSVLDAYPAIS